MFGDIHWLRLITHTCAALEPVSFTISIVVKINKQFFKNKSIPILGVNELSSTNLRFDNGETSIYKNLLNINKREYRNGGGEDENFLNLE